MLTVYEELATEQAPATPSSEINATSEVAKSGVVSGAGRSRLARALRIEWLGQTAASLFWIASVLTYGISSTGDWLQICAASAWLLANVASIVTAEPA
ncbi:MAG: hypothetical protein MI757_01200 [Pirellulales bacterium]|nr:hypothetical protein [Pirellulales bacterium]